MSLLNKAIVIILLITLPVIYFAANNENDLSCQVNATLEHQNLVASLTSSIKQRLKNERSVSGYDICNMPLAKLKKALSRLEEPKPDHPGEAYSFRYKQQLSENNQLNTKNWRSARDYVQKLKNRQIAGAGINPTSWESIGPGNIGGRIRSMAFDPDNSERIYAGSVSGGVWVTENAGASWSPTDDFMGNLSVSTIIFDPTDSDVIYAGTGEGTFNIDNVRGMGIFKSQDKGASWEALSSTQNSYNFYWVNRITMLNDSSQLFAATHTGIWRSSDGGESWERVYTGRSNDIDVDPNNDSLLIAGTWGKALYSTDKGINWNTASGLESIGSRRIEIAYARSNSQIVYASIDNNNGEVYKSTDGGQTYNLVNTGNSYLGSQGWYDNALWVDPTNPDHLIVGGLDLWRSTDGGINFTKISTWWQAPNSPHADHHFIIEHPDYDAIDNKQVYFANDGGVYTAANIEVAQGSTGWQELNNQLTITQFYGIGVTTDGTVVGGTQDNGTLVYKGDSENWTATFGGDGGYSAADPVDPNYLYGEYVYLQIHRSRNGGLSSSFIHDSQMESNANFIAPFILDPNNSSRLLGGSGSLWVSDNAKANTPTWSSIKDPISGNTPISAIAVANGNSDLIYVGYNDGSIYKTINGTSASPTWSSVAGMDMPQRFVMRITIDPQNNDIIFVTYSGYEENNLWKSTDAGASFNVSVGTAPNRIPSAPIRTLVVHPTNTQRVYAGTEVGIFTSDDGGTSWDFNNNGPANVSVDELVWGEENVLYAATHGRGIFKATVSQSAPDTLNFETVNDATLGTLYTSNEQTISGLTAAIDLNIVNGEYSIGCSETYATANTQLNNGDTICLRHISSEEHWTTTTTQLTVGEATFSFKTRTLADTTPDDISFTSVADVALDTLQVSNAVTITGISHQVDINITNGEYSINCNPDNFTSESGTIALDDSVCLRHNSSTEYGITTTTEVNIGTLNLNYSSTTLPDTTPDDFTFEPVNDVPRASEQRSATKTITGFQVAVPIRVTGGEYSLDCDPNTFTNIEGEISPDQSVCVRHTASVEYATSAKTTLNINGVTSDFISTTTLDKEPDTFTFTAQSNVELNTLITSNTVTITGIATEIDVSISNGEYSIGCTENFTSATGKISNEQTICLRHTSATTHSTSLETLLTLENMNVSFISTTKAAPQNTDNGSESSGGGSFGVLWLLSIGLLVRVRNNLR